MNFTLKYSKTYNCYEIRDENLKLMTTGDDTPENAIASLLSNYPDLKHMNFTVKFIMNWR